MEDCFSSVETIQNTTFYIQIKNINLFVIFSINSELASILNK